MTRLNYRGFSYDTDARKNVAKPQGDVRETLLYRGYEQNRTAVDYDTAHAAKSAGTRFYRGYKSS